MVASIAIRMAEEPSAVGITGAGNATVVSIADCPSASSHLAAQVAEMEAFIGAKTTTEEALGVR
jgi:tRNA/tmRNA/rRNA uracil-C5-methylase (TrmA/RlmC/RlmD family)